MKGNDLFIAMSGIGEDLIDEGEHAAFPARRRSVRPIILAALVAVMILLMGCAATYLLRVQNFKVGERTVTREVWDESFNVIGYADVTEDVLALSGLKGSPCYQATVEWFAFKNAMDPDNALQNAYYNAPNRQTFPAQYDAYQPYTQEMVEKLDELAAKYGLKLLGGLERFQYETEFLNGTGIPSILLPGARFTLQFQNGSRYAEGNFGFVYELTPLDDADSWPPAIWGTCNYYRNDCLDPSILAIDSGESTEERSFTTANGENVLIVIPSPYAAMVFYSTEDATMVLLISTLQKPFGDVVSLALTQAQLEAIINSFDFSISA